MATGVAGLPPYEHRYFGTNSSFRNEGQLASERKKPFLFPRMMNNTSSSWASYCSSIACFRSIGESGVGSFAHVLLKFGCFQPNVQAGVSALTQCIHNSKWNKSLFACVRCNLLWFFIIIYLLKLRQLIQILATQMSHIILVGWF